MALHNKCWYNCLPTKTGTELTKCQADDVINPPYKSFLEKLIIFGI